MKANAGDSGPRRKWGNKRFSPRSDDGRRLALKENKIETCVWQNAVCIHRIRALNRLRPETQNMLAQCDWGQVFAVLGDARRLFFRHRVNVAERLRCADTH